MEDSKKIVLIGDGGVGKTTFIKQVINNAFEKRYLSTLGCEVSTYLNLSIWDINGQEKYGGLKDMYYNQASLGVFFFDLTSKITYKNLQEWINNFKNINPNVPIVIVGNKIDIEENIKVSQQDIDNLFNITNYVYCLSCKNYNSCLELINTIIDICNPV